MLHPRRLLQDLVDGELPDRRRIGVERHVARCSACAATVSRLRALKSALLGLRRPVPDPEFQRRLLAPTAAVEGPPRFQRREDRAGSSAAFVRDHHERTEPHRRRRTAVAAAGGTVVVAGAILGSAYIVGSEAASTTIEAADGSTALRAGWESVAPRTPTTLDAEQLDTLRAGGWYCPELESLGFTLSSAEGITVDGRPTLELTLENDGSTVTVYEQRKVGDEGGGAAAPFSAVTGRVVTADGFEHVGGADRDLWVRSGEPWQVVLDSPTVTYTVVSSMPAAAMPQTLSQLVTTEHAQLAVTPPRQEESMMERIVRGLSMITHPGGSSH
ncbi:anti-sigma factor family protein [Arthrobacter sp. Leaf234]|uniref:anti-sigma factor family protein n=1 Tax=Arthrobacter sp. Leaf234 TaxID=1736303 RepID=UPI0009EBD156|nr:zf-HC2 domain-containing protein [Arthrobacter sp. Leaf234]